MYIAYRFRIYPNDSEKIFIYKTCSVCGAKTKLTESLGVREWECEVCRTHHDRDINASINILLKGLKYCFGK